MASAEPDDWDQRVVLLAADLARRWMPDFVTRDWGARLQLLNEMHEQLLEDLGDLDLYCAVSPIFIRQLIKELADGPINSVAQAHIYANSADAEDRRAAGQWLARHAPAR